MSKLRFTFIVLAFLLIATVASSQPTAAPSPSPTKKKVTPTPAPVAVPASPPTDYMAPSPSTIADSPTGETADCTTLLFGTADCLSYVETGSNLTEPDKACCPELATLVSTNPICLCQLLKKGGGSLGIDIDMTRALALPAACKVDTPDPSLCALVNGGSPAEAPAAMSPTANLGPSGSANPPSAQENGASSIGLSATNLVVTLMAAAAFSWKMF